MKEQALPKDLRTPSNIAQLYHMSPFMNYEYPPQPYYGGYSFAPSYGGFPHPIQSSYAGAPIQHNYPIPPQHQSSAPPPPKKKLAIVNPKTNVVVNDASPNPEPNTNQTVNSPAPSKSVDSEEPQAAAQNQKASETVLSSSVNPVDPPTTLQNESSSNKAVTESSSERHTSSSEKSNLSENKPIVDIPVKLPGQGVQTLESNEIPKESLGEKLNEADQSKEFPNDNVPQQQSEAIPETTELNQEQVTAPVQDKIEVSEQNKSDRITSADEAIPNDSSVEKENLPESNLNNTPNKIGESKPEPELDIKQSESDGGFIQIQYPEGIWGPHNPTGSKKYPRDFLLLFKEYCLHMPEGLNPRIVADESKQPGNYPVRSSFHAPRNSPLRGNAFPRPGFNTNFGPPGFDRMRNQMRYPPNARMGPPQDRRVPGVEPLVKSDNAWQRPRRVDEDKIRLLIMKVNGLLNKITDETFEPLSEQIVGVGIDSIEIMEKVISCIFEKALLEPGYSSMYAKLCVKLSSRIKLVDDNGKVVQFRSLLLNKCQAYFETKHSFERTEEDQKLTDEEWEEKVYIKRMNILGNIKFIGELFKKHMVAERIIHFCIVHLLQSSINGESIESLECLCGLMTNIGQLLDHEKGRSRVDEYFREMVLLAQNPSIDSRLRFKLADVIELRGRHWAKIKKDDIGRKEGEVKRPNTTARPPIQIAKNPNVNRMGSKGDHSPHHPTVNRNDRQVRVPDRRNVPTRATQPERPAAPAIDPKVHEKKIDDLIEEYMTSRDDNEAAECVKELNNHNLHSKIVSRALLYGLEKKEKERQIVMDLFGGLTDAGLLDQTHLLAGFRTCFENLNDLVIDCPRAPDYFGATFATTVHHGRIVSFSHLKEWSEKLPGRIADAVYGSAFSKFADLRGETELVSKLRDMGIMNVKDLFSQKNPDDLRKTLDRFELGFLESP